MSEDDFLIARSVNAPETEILPEPVSGATANHRAVEQRILRKKSLALQPSSIHRGTHEAWKELDRRMAESFPGFDERMWTLGQAALWIAERTSAAVNGVTIDTERLFEVVPQIHKALAAGEIRAWSHTANDPVPRELPRETWEVYQLAIEQEGHLLWILPVRESAPRNEPVLRHVRLVRDDVLRRWPDPKRKKSSPPLGTVAAENACRSWLKELMKAGPERPRSKQTLCDEAKKRFPRLSQRAFDRAWTYAISESGAELWSAPGRRSSRTDIKQQRRKPQRRK